MHISHESKINVLQAFMIMMLFNGLTSHVIVNPLLLDASGRDAWIAVLVATCLYLPWCALVVYIMRKSGQRQITVWLTEKTNRIVAWIFLIPFCLQLYFIGASTVIHTSIWTITYYLPSTPQYALVFVLIAVCHFAAQSGIRTIGIGAGIMLPIVVCLGYFVSITNIPEKDFSLMRPILEHGWKPVFSGAIDAGGAFVEIVLLLFFQHRLKAKMRVWQAVLLGSVLVYITLGPLIGSIVEFGPKEAAKQMISPYEQWRLVKLGNYVEHLDFLSVYQWMAGATVRISLAQFMLAELFPFRTDKARKWFIRIISLSFFIMAILLGNKAALYLKVYELYFPIILYVTLAISLTWASMLLFAKPELGRRT
ncbi:MAG: spore gernimation protein [Paenibacillus sp.]|jgi:spore germination protein (amino acid permease)|nr:spore gernimation protein [Paenibacillus sp.]